MAFLVKLIVFGFIALVASYYGIYFLVAGGMSPEEQAQQLRDQVQPGMSWVDVVDIREPKRVLRTSFSNMGMPRQIESDYDKDNVRTMVSSGKAADGFAFPFVFSSNTAFSINFDASGAVTSVTDDATANDLFNGKLFSP
ncbi:MAG: hypothetical protein RIG82_13775 [Phycisphaeraceae bacterium]